MGSPPPPRWPGPSLRASVSASLSSSLRFCLRPVAVPVSGRAGRRLRGLGAGEASDRKRRRAWLATGILDIPLTQDMSSMPTDVAYLQHATGMARDVPAGGGGDGHLSRAEGDKRQRGWPRGAHVLRSRRGGRAHQVQGVAQQGLAVGFYGVWGSRRGVVYGAWQYGIRLVRDERYNSIASRVPYLSSRTWQYGIQLARIRNRRPLAQT